MRMIKTRFSFSHWCDVTCIWFWFSFFFFFCFIRFGKSNFRSQTLNWNGAMRNEMECDVWWLGILWMSLWHMRICDIHTFTKYYCSIDKFITSSACLLTVLFNKCAKSTCLNNETKRKKALTWNVWKMLNRCHFRMAMSLSGKTWFPMVRLNQPDSSSWHLFVVCVPCGNCSWPKSEHDEAAQTIGGPLSK